MVICAGNYTTVYEEVLQIGATVVNVLGIYNSDEKDVKRFQIDEPKEIGQIFQYFQNIQKYVKEPVDYFCFQLHFACGNKFRKEFVEVAKRHGIKNVCIIGRTKARLIDALSIFPHNLQQDDAFWIILHNVTNMHCFIYKYDEKNGWHFRAQYHQIKSRFHNDPYRKLLVLTEDLQKLKAQIKETEVIPFLFVFTERSIGESSVKKFPKVFPCKDFFLYRYKSNNSPPNSPLIYARYLSGEAEYAKYKSEELLEKSIEVKMGDKTIVQATRFHILPLTESVVINNDECDSLKVFSNEDFIHSIAFKNKGSFEIKLDVDSYSIYDISIQPQKNVVIANNALPLKSRRITFDDDGIQETDGVLNFEVEKTDPAAYPKIFNLSTIF